MYFDFLYYRKVLSYTWAQTQWPGRNKTLFKLLVLVPLTTALHALCFALDYVFFSRARAPAGKGAGIYRGARP